MTSRIVAVGLVLVGAGLANDRIGYMSCGPGHPPSPTVAADGTITVSRDAVRAVDLCWLKPYFHPWLEEAICPPAKRADERCRRMEWTAADLPVLRRAAQWHRDADQHELGSHYQLLYFLAKHFTNETLVDIGTGFGGSALALAAAEASNLVFSYDTYDFFEHIKLYNDFDYDEFRYRLPNIVFRCCKQDVRQQSDILAAAAIIMLDATRKGPFEREMYQLLEKIGFSGLLVIAHYRRSQILTDLWNGITRPKFDVSIYGTNCAECGTGIVDFSGTDRIRLLDGDSTVKREKLSVNAQELCSTEGMYGVFGQSLRDNPYQKSIRVWPRDKPAKIIDACMFNNELDMLELRLLELSPVIDQFVLCESNVTHGMRDTKPLHFQNNRHMFGKYLHKIKHLIYPGAGKGAWDREQSQRAYMRHGIDGQDDNTFVIISDVDEIPRPEVLGFFKHCHTTIDHFMLGTVEPITCLFGLWHTSTIYFKKSTEWHGMVVVPLSRYSSGKLVEMQEIDGVKQMVAHTNVSLNEFQMFCDLPSANAGHHLSYFGSTKMYFQKMRDSPHDLYNMREHYRPSFIRYAVLHGQTNFHNIKHNEHNVAIRTNRIDIECMPRHFLRNLESIEFRFDMEDDDPDVMEFMHGVATFVDG
jgi:hypothetical protein